MTTQTTGPTPKRHPVKCCQDCPWLHIYEEEYEKVCRLIPVRRGTDSHGRPWVMEHELIHPIEATVDPECPLRTGPVLVELAS